MTAPSRRQLDWEGDPTLRAILRRKWVNENKTCDQIAAEMGTTRSAISSAICRYDLPMRQPGKQGFTRKQKAERRHPERELPRAGKRTLPILPSLVGFIE